MVLGVVYRGSTKADRKDMRKGAGASIVFLLIFGPVIWMLTPIRTIARRLSRD
jgi:hypothetical protein